MLLLTILANRFSLKEPPTFNSLYELFLLGGAIRNMRSVSIFMIIKIPSNWDSKDRVLPPKHPISIDRNAPSLIMLTEAHNS